MYITNKFIMILLCLLILNGCGKKLEPLISKKITNDSSEKSYKPLSEASLIKVKNLIKTVDNNVSEDIDLSKLRLLSCKVDDIKSSKAVDINTKNSFNNFYSINYLDLIINFNANNINEIKYYKNFAYFSDTERIDSNDIFYGFRRDKINDYYYIHSKCFEIQNTLFNNDNKYPNVIPLNNIEYEDTRAISNSKNLGSEVLDTSMAEAFEAADFSLATNNLSNGGNVFDLLNLAVIGISKLNRAHEKSKAEEAEEIIKNKSDKYQCTLIRKEGSIIPILTDNFEVIITKRAAYYEFEDKTTFKDTYYFVNGMLIKHFKHTTLSQSNLYFSTEDDKGELKSNYTYLCNLKNNFSQK